MMTHEIVPDAEIESVHANANFGDMPKRRVVDEGVIKYALGYEGGSTQMKILLEHKLIRKPKMFFSKSTLTRKGVKYLHALFGADPRGVINQILGLSL